METFELSPDGRKSFRGQGRSGDMEEITALRVRIERTERRLRMFVVALVLILTRIRRHCDGSE